MSDLDYLISQSIVTNREVLLLSVNPELSEWKCYPFGSPDFVLIHQKGSVPNWFWRKMQYLILGFKWVKNPKEKGE